MDEQLKLPLMPEERFSRWFRGLSRRAQRWAAGPILAACFALTWLQAHAVLAGMRSQEEQPEQAIWVTLILFVVTIVLNELLRPKPNIEDARPAGLGDFQFPTATEGRPVPVPFGRVRQKGPNVVWYGDLFQEAVTKFFKSGLWSGKRVTTGFKYNIGVQFALGRGVPGAPVALRRVWIGDTEVFTGNITTETFFDINQPELFGGDELGNGGVLATCDFYTGSNSQAVSPYLDTTDRQRIASAATPTCPRYTGTCYVVAREFTSAAPAATNIGAYVGNSTTVKPWSFEIERFSALFSGQSGSDNKIGAADCNPINVIYELLTNKEWGFGFPATDIDVGASSSFVNASEAMKDEANGFSFLMDRQMGAKAFLQELQRQIDGVVYLSQSTGKWTIQLARGPSDTNGFGYDINTVPQLTDDNVAEVKDYTRGAWEDTTNTIQVEYDKRDDDYKLSYALAQDVANAQMQGDGTISGAVSTVGKVKFPGVKNSALASNLAWRELRGQTYPLARCTLVVNQQMWDLSIGDVVAWTNTRLGFTKLPMRITRIDYGRMTSNKMAITVVQDVFKFAAASMGTPPSTGWTPPSTTPVAFPAAEQLAIECPRAIAVREPEVGTSYDVSTSKLFCAGRNQGVEVAFEIRERHAAGTPAGSFATAGDIVQFMRIGELQSALGAGVSNPTSTITVVPDPDSQTRIESAFDDSTTLADMGTQLAQLILVGNEFMLVADAANNAANVDLQNVYRGALDSVQENHAAGADVFLIFVGAGVSDTALPNTDNVDVKLLPRTAQQTLAEGSATTIALTMDKRALRPYAPGAVLYNGTGTRFGTPNVEGDGSGENGFGFDVDWWRRRFDTTDELQELLGDNTPDASTEYQVRVFVDPDGSNTEIASSPFGWATGSGTIQVPRLDLLEVAAAGTEIRVEIEARHDILSEVNLRSRHDMIHDVVPTSVNDGLFYLGGNIGTGPSNSYAVVTAVAHDINIGAAMTTANAQYRINGGSWVTIVGTSATTAVLAVSDTIEVRVDSGTYSPDPNFVWIEESPSTRVAYGTL